MAVPMQDQLVLASRVVLGQLVRGVSFGKRMFVDEI